MELHIRDVSKTYPNGVQALKDVTLTIPAGMYGLLGRNGAGKSTLMRILATLQEPDDGSIGLGDIDVVRQKERVRETLGYLPQSFGFHPRANAERLLDCGRGRRCAVRRRSFDSQWRDPEQPDQGPDRFHVAINMDGNGRWALARGRPREQGHVAGVAAVRRTVEAAPALGITTLTLYAFSSDNWRRPRGEVDNLMFLLKKYIDVECDDLIRTGVRFTVIGRRDRISGSLKRSIADLEERTQQGTSLHLRVAIDYSARDALLAAAGRIARGIPPTREAFERSLREAIHAPSGTRDVDLLIRTGGEQRLSDFLLWESAYAELYFTDVPWPDFSEADLASAVQAFAARDRRYGGLLKAAP
jgi:undecaprenyl diphosphate synthase